MDVWMRKKVRKKKPMFLDFNRLILFFLLSAKLSFSVNFIYQYIRFERIGDWYRCHRTNLRNVMEFLMKFSLWTTMMMQWNWKWLWQQPNKQRTLAPKNEKQEPTESWEY